MGPYPGVVSPTCVDPKNSSTCCQGQKPSVILRGGPQGNGGFPPSVRTQTWKPRSIYLYSYAAIAGWSRAPHERTTVLGRSTCCPSGTSPSGAAAFVRATASHSQVGGVVDSVSLIREHRETEYQQTFCAASNYQKVECGDPATGKPNPALAGDLAP